MKKRQVNKEASAIISVYLTNGSKNTSKILDIIG
jgi:hypothetical protein